VQPEWDDNFIVSSGIPEYKAFNNAYGLAYNQKKNSQIKNMR
jgi:hypothetical protein